MWELDCEESWALKNWCFWTVVLENIFDSPLDIKEIKPVNPKSTLNIHWKDWCWSFSNLATWCKEPTHWKRPWCWKRLKAGGEWDNRGWNGWMASLTQWVCTIPGRWWRTRKPGVLQSMGAQWGGCNWATEKQELWYFGLSELFRRNEWNTIFLHPYITLVGHNVPGDSNKLAK